MRKVRAAIAAIVVLLVAPVSASALPRGDADHSDVYFPSTDGSMLHAQVLRPSGVPGRVKTPVVVSVGPYFSTGPVRAAGDGPERFYDFLDVTNILARGYTYVMVDLPGFGGSSGCNDWGGAREQGAVKAAVEWAASQRWSTGRVGLVGKSYDAWTGLMGIAQQPKGLAAVVAMEPVYSGYRYLYTNGVRQPNHLGTPALFQAEDALPSDPTGPPEYFVNGLPQFWCYAPNIALQQQDDENAAYWKERNLLPAVKGKRTPVFLTQGFLETNTKPDAAYEFFTSMAGPKRAWFGQFDHVRGWEKTGKVYATGRSVFAKELVRFLDRHLKGIAARSDPNVAVQDNLGRYRAETRWPPPDATRLWSALRPGSYMDDGMNVGTGAQGGRGIWTFSQAVPHDVWLAGEPILDVRVDAPLPGANLVADLYDVHGGDAVLISRGTELLRGSGAQRVSFRLYGQDWMVREGHRLALLVSGANAEWWEHVPTGMTVDVSSARIGLPFLTRARTTFLDGTKTPRLDEHLRDAYVSVTPPTIRSNGAGFRLPGPLD
jgi:pimeloyl-ACP methyl ester carboxylesterase